MIGRTYTLKGAPVVVLARWGDVTWGVRPSFGLPLWPANRKPRGAPRNVRIRHADGTLTIRPFRGLRKVSPGDAPGPSDTVGASR